MSSPQVRADVLTKTGKMKNSQLTKIQVSVNQLDEKMTILAYTAFNKIYRKINKETCTFIRHNFKGTSVQIIRDEQQLNLGVDQLRQGDSLLRIYNFPESLKKITEVKPKLISELKRRGMVGFIVKQKTDLAEQSKRDLKKIIKKVESSTSEVKGAKNEKSRKAPKLFNSIEQTNHFVYEVKESISLKNQASESIKASMDNARKGTVAIDELQESVDSILSQSSPETLAAMMNLKEGDHTYDHCVDVGALFQTVYEKITKNKGFPSAFKSKNQVMLSGFLHDFGKSRIPVEVLETTKRYSKSSQEMDLLRSHPLYGAVLLSELDMPKAAINMTHYHHVKQDGEMENSYPEGVDWSEVSYETRLLTIVDSYQALAGRRQYKRSWPAPATMKYLDTLAGIEFDLEAWEDFLTTLGIYPRGSLVQLSDGSMGFVMIVPEQGKDLERPMVAVVRNSDGEDLTHHHLVDLEVEMDMSIEKDLDHLEVFGEETLDVFTGIQVS